MLATLTPSDRVRRSLALYSLANSTGAPDAHRAASHALAGALAALMQAQAEVQAVRASMPGATTARKARKAAEKDSRMDLARPLKVTPRNRTTGAYTARFADGSETFVSGVVSDVRDPATRWIAAAQAADRLRRMRERRAYLAELLQDGAPAGLWAVGAGIRQETPAFWRGLFSRPLAPLASLTCADTGETFDATTAHPFGAGDPDELAKAAATMARPFRLMEKES